MGGRLLEASDRWPSTAKAGRTDYLRGVASLGEGERDKAEAYFLKSFRADSTYLWVVVDLAKLVRKFPRSPPGPEAPRFPYLQNPSGGISATGRRHPTPMDGSKR